MLIRLTVQLVKPFEFQARNMNILLTILHECIFVFYSRSSTAKNLSRRQRLTLWNLHLVVFTQFFIHSLHDEHKKNDYLTEKSITQFLSQGRCNFASNGKIQFNWCWTCGSRKYPYTVKYDYQEIVRGRKDSNFLSKGWGMDIVWNNTKFYLERYNLILITKCQSIYWKES